MDAETVASRIAVHVGESSAHLAMTSAICKVEGW